ncbi:cytochrome b562 [Pontibacterium granulatum]|uniref:cytochrome b562 n=1 Tax=Pontibacterium granulatum TaxID=2036029 RepID=UPI00249B6338|nr:cytochrome b562 [Pontibacterium granulatum]MDI3326820.1 cytochrome b562 [Pontibacterium granulatum]
MPYVPVHDPGYSARETGTVDGEQRFALLIALDYSIRVFDAAERAVVFEYIAVAGGKAVSSPIGVVLQANVVDHADLIAMAHIPSGLANSDNVHQKFRPVLYMKHSATKPLLGSLLLTLLLATAGFANANESPSLKQTMKQMRLHYKEALVSQSAEGFNQHIDAFKTLLNSAQAYEFSPERKAVSLEGLTKVERVVADIPLATADNLAGLQQKIRGVDLLRKEYHKKAKPSTWDLILNLLK